MSENEICLRIGYMGVPFYGTNPQPGRRTVHSELAKALKHVGLTCDISFASRTDRGVQARRNVVLLRPGHDVIERLSGIVDELEGVWISGWCPVPAGFNPRRAAARTYRYILPGAKQWCYIERAKEAAELFTGVGFLKDFYKRDTGRPGLPEPRIFRSQMVIDSPPYLEVSASHFLWQMMRRMARAVMEVGTGKMALAELKERLRKPRGGLQPAPASRLILWDIEYAPRLPFRSIPAPGWMEELKGDMTTGLYLLTNSFKET